MKKRVILSTIITGTIVGLTSQLWLFREPVNVTFNAEGTGLTSFEIVLNKKMMSYFQEIIKQRSKLI